MNCKKKMLKEENNFIVDMKNVYNNNVKNDWEIFKNKQKNICDWLQRHAKIICIKHTHTLIWSLLKREKILFKWMQKC